MIRNNEILQSYITQHNYFLIHVRDVEFEFKALDSRPHCLLLRSILARINKFVRNHGLHLLMNCEARNVITKDGARMSNEDPNMEHNVARWRTDTVAPGQHTRSSDPILFMTRVK